VLKVLRVKEKLAGRFFVLDGPDGCGKSTQTRLLADWMRGHSLEAETFRDPGDTAIGEKIRQILLDPLNNAMSSGTELLLYMAARAQLWREKIAPALNQGKCVVMDRWISSTCAYQGYAGGFGIDNVIRIAEGSLERIWPALTVILDVDLETASQRLNRQLDRMEQKGGRYHKKVREGFLKFASGRENVVVIDASADVDEVHQRIVNEFLSF